MSTKKIYEHFISSLQKLYSIAEATAITNIVFESIAGIGKIKITTGAATALPAGIMNKLSEALEALMQHTPVQYVVGEAWFLQLKLKVGPAVLIPRPETEELVLEIINVCKKPNTQSAIDIGTGSGCIAIALKKNMPALSVSAIDISEEALAMAKENAVAHHTDIQFICSNFLEENNWLSLSKYDIIVSNPPYIPLADKLSMDTNVVAHEPHTALFVADDTPLIFYEKIALFGKNHLAENGIIFLETHHQYAAKIAEHFNNNGYKAMVKEDMFEKGRFVIATLCQ